MELKKKIIQVVDKFKLKFTIKSKFKKYTIICDRIHADPAIKSVLLAYFANKKEKLIPIIFNEGKNKSISLDIFKCFGMNKFYNTAEFHFFTIRNFYLLIYFIKANLLILFKGFDFFVKNFKISNIYFGDLIYDKYSRYNFNFSRTNHYNKFFIKELLLSINKIIFIKLFLKNNDVKLTIIGQHCYANNSTFLARLVAKKKIKCFLVSGGSVIYYKNPSFSLRYPFKILAPNIKKVDFTNPIIKKNYKKHISKRNSGMLHYLHDNVNSNLEKKIYTNNSLDKYFKINKKIIKYKIFYPAHAFADAPHACGKLLFRDYFEQIVKTINFVKKKQEILLLVKPHPSSYLLDEEGFLERYFVENKLTKYKNIKLVPKDVKTNSIIKYADATVTCSGTAGLESAAFYGKRPILAGDSFYSDLGFTLDCKSKKKYFKLLANVAKVKPLNPNQILNANKTLYVHECLNNFNNFGNIFPKSLKKIKNNKIYLTSNKEYFNTLNKNLNKSKLINDKYYKYLQNKIYKNL